MGVLFTLVAIFCITAWFIWRVLNWLFGPAIREVRRQFVLYMYEQGIPYGFAETMFNLLAVLIIALILKMIS